MTGSDAAEARISNELYAVARRALDAGRTPPAYVRRYLVRHALAGDVVQARLIPDDFLPYVDVKQLLAMIGPRDVERARDFPALGLLRQVAHLWDWDRPDRNAATLEMWSALAGKPFARPIGSPAAAWHVRWAVRRPNPSVIIGRHTSDVWSVTTGTVRGRPVAATGGGEGTVQIWDLTTGLLDVSLPGTRHPVQALALVDEADAAPMLVAGRADGSVETWDLALGVQRQRWQASTNVRTLAVLQDSGGTVLLTGGEDGVVARWRLDGTPAGDPMRFDATVYATAIAGTTIVVSSGNGTLTMVSAAGRIRLAGHAAPVRALTVANGSTLVSGDDNGVVLRWDLARAVPTGRYDSAPSRRVTAVASLTAPDGRDVVLATQDRQLLAWELASGQPLGPPLVGSSMSLTSVAAAVDDRVAVVTGCRDGSVRLWDPLAPPADPGGARYPGRVQAVALGELPGTGDVIVTGGPGTLGAWHLATGTPAGRPPEGHRAVVQSLRTHRSATGALLGVAGGYDGSLVVWDVATGDVAAERRAHQSAVVGVVDATLADGRPGLATVGRLDLTVWDMESWTPVASWPYPQHADQRDGWARVGAAAALVPPDGPPLVVTGDTDGVVRFWDTAGQARLDAELHTGGSGVAALAVGDIEGRSVILAGTQDGVVLAWDLASGDELCRTRAHGDALVAMATALLPGGQLVVATVGLDDTVVLTDVSTGGRVGVPLPTMTGPRSVMVHQRPTPVLVIGGDGLAAVEITYTRD